MYYTDPTAFARGPVLVFVFRLPPHHPDVPDVSLTRLVVPALGAPDVILVVLVTGGPKFLTGLDVFFVGHGFLSLFVISFLFNSAMLY